MDVYSLPLSTLDDRDQSAVVRTKLVLKHVLRRPIVRGILVIVIVLLTVHREHVTRRVFGQHVLPIHRNQLVSGLGVRGKVTRANSWVRRARHVTP